MPEDRTRAEPSPIVRYGAPSAFSASVVSYVTAFATLVYGVAWVAPVQGNTRGYEAFRVTFPMVWEVWKDPSVEPLKIIAALTPHTNYLMAAALWLVFARGSSAALRRITILLFAAFACNLVWLVPTPKELLSGYYLWLFSFPLMACATGLARHGAGR